MEELEVVEEESVGKLWTDGGRIKSFSCSSVASFPFFRLHWPSCPNNARSLLTWLVIVVLQLFRDSLSFSSRLSILGDVEYSVIKSNKKEKVVMHIAIQY